MRHRPALIPAILVGVFFFGIYLLSGSSDLKHNGDTYLRYQTTQSIVDSGHIWVAHPAWTDTRMALGVGHHLYAFYAPGQAVFMLPLYVLGKAIAHHLSLPYDVTTLYACRALDLILGALLAVVFFLLALSLGYSMRVAIVLTLVLGLASPAWPDAQSALEQTQVDLFLLLSVYCVWRSVPSPAARRWLVVGGAAAGLAVFTRYDAVLFVPLVGLFAPLVRVARRKPGAIGDALAFGIGAVPWFLAVGAWNWARFGSPFLTGLHERTFGEPFWSGFLGLTVSPGKGLLWYSPLVLLLPWTLRAFARRAGPLTILLAAVVIVPLLFYSQVLYWHGDPAWGPRYLYTSLPYLILPLGEILATWRTRALGLRAALVVLVGASLLLQVCAVSVTEWRYWYRLEATQQRAAHANAWSGRPFYWGATRYRYYWHVNQSPIPIQIDNVYQVLRLSAGDQRYRLTARPDPYVSNPVDNYPVNELAFWWVDSRHPLLGGRTRGALALMLLLVSALAGLGLSRYARDVRARGAPAQLEVVPAP